MAIKVISKPIGKAIYQGECNICHTRFEFEHSDANDYIDSQIEGESYNVTCPWCNAKTWVKKKIFRYE
jgi:mono/diheme cytochrome c family protein